MAQAGSAATPADSRREAGRDFRRAHILAAARQVFHARGLESATIRGIAEAAGYTAGAIYAYYPTKEAIYADLLLVSLAALRKDMKSAIDAAPDDEARVRAAIQALYGYYRTHPQELDLGFYLFQGMRPRGLTPELNKRLNTRFVSALRLISESLARFARIPPLATHTETVAAGTHVFGVLLMAHTGRLRILDAAPDRLIAHYTDYLIARLRPARGAGPPLIHANRRREPWRQP